LRIELGRAPSVRRSRSLARNAGRRHGQLAALGLAEAPWVGRELVGDGYRFQRAARNAARRVSIGNIH
jgi:hypothetical protein